MARDRVSDKTAEGVGPICRAEAVSHCVVRSIQCIHTYRPERCRRGPGAAVLAVRWEGALVRANAQKITEALLCGGPAKAEALLAEGMEGGTKSVML